jgi:hypothetical protein
VTWHLERRDPGMRFRPVSGKAGPSSGHVGKPTAVNAESAGSPEAHRQTGRAKLARILDPRGGWLLWWSGLTMSRRGSGSADIQDSFGMFTMEVVDIPVLNRIVSKVWSKTCKGRN